MTNPSGVPTTDQRSGMMVLRSINSAVLCVRRNIITLYIIANTMLPKIPIKNPRTKILPILALVCSCTLTCTDGVGFTFTVLFVTSTILNVVIALNLLLYFISYLFCLLSDIVCYI